MPAIAAWNMDSSRIVPWDLYQRLSLNDGAPPTDWADSLFKQQVSEQWISILEPLRTDAPDYCEPCCCLANTVVFYYPPWPRLMEHSRIEYRQRTFPCTSFAVLGEWVYEITGARIVHVFHKWHVEWTGAKNTDLARHFNGLCDRHCRPCRVLNQRERR